MTTEELHLLHIPEWNDLRNGEHALEVAAVGDWREELAEPDVRYEVPIVLLHLARDRLLLVEACGGSPFVTQLFVVLIGRPAEPAFLAGRLMADPRDRVADRGRAGPGDEDLPGALVRWRL